MDERAAVLDAVATHAATTERGHPTRIAVEGVTAAGKTTFADDLAAALRARGRRCDRLSMDGYHHPAAHRRRQGRLSADGYYEDAYDLDALRAQVLDPLGPGGDGRYRPAIIDLAADRPVAPSTMALPADGLLVVDGSFLARRPVGDAWDLRIWLDVPFDVARARGVARDTTLLGGEAAAETAFRERYHAACRRYLDEEDPIGTAQVVVELSDPSAPALQRPAP